jgi:phage/plasmid-associated DNA primase
VLQGRYLDSNVELLRAVDAGDADAAQSFKETLLGTLLFGCFLGDDDADEKVAMLQEIMGLVAAGWATRIRSPRAIVALGERAGNGKSQFSELLRGLVPPANRSSVSPADFSNEYYTHLLVGVLLNAVDELPERAIQSDRFKAVITGDLVPARQIYQEAGVLRPQALHWMTTNQLPRFRDGVDAGVLRRLVFIRFDRVVPESERIPWLGARIAEEEQDLLVAFAAQGLARFLRNGDYTVPSSSNEVLAQFLREGDSVRGWLADRTTYDPDSTERVFAADAYEDYRAWAADQGIQGSYIVTRNTFGKRISRALPELPPESRRKSNGKMYYPGLTLSPSEVGGDEFDDIVT